MEKLYSELFDLAYNLHVSGKFEEAEAAYERLLARSPDDINVLNLYAQLLVSLKDYEQAIEIFTRLYDKTKLDSVLINISKAYFGKGEYQNVISSLKKLKKNTVESVRLYAVSYLKSGNNERAAANYKALADNNSADFADLYNLSYLYNSMGNIDEALKYSLAAYKIKSDDIDLNKFIAGLYQKRNDLNNELTYLLNISNLITDKEILYRIGVLYSGLGYESKAVEYFNNVLNIEPNNRRALLYIANIYKRHDKKKSFKIFERMYNEDNQDEGVIFNLNLLCTQMLDAEGALYWAEKFMAVSDDRAFSCSLKADALMELYRYKEAEDYYKKSLDINSDNDYVKLQLAYIYSFTDRVKEAYEMFDLVLEKTSILKDYTIIKLREKKLDEVREGFYDWNFKLTGADKPRQEKIAREMFNKFNIEEKYGISEDSFVLFKEMQNNGSEEAILKYRLHAWKEDDITGKRLLIYSAHGVGDMFMFSRYISQVKEKAKEIILQVPSSCLDLYKYNFPELKIFTSKEKIEDDLYDYTSPYMTLIYGLHSSLENIPLAKGYLSVSDEIVKQKSALDFMNTSNKKVGIFWQGNPSVYRNRSVKLRYFIPLFELEDIQIYSFQISTVDYESDELKPKLPLIDLAPHIKSYEDTAAFLRNIDVLVTIDTSIANLAGAMGVKTYLLLPYLSEWRWFNDTETTPWYNSVRIFKQKVPGDWDEVILRVKNELSL